MAAHYTESRDFRFAPTRRDTLAGSPALRCTYPSSSGPPYVAVDAFITSNRSTEVHQSSQTTPVRCSFRFKGRKSDACLRRSTARTCTTESDSRKVSFRKRQSPRHEEKNDDCIYTCCFCVLCRWRTCFFGDLCVSLRAPCRTDVETFSFWSICNSPPLFSMDIHDKEGSFYRA